MQNISSMMLFWFFYPIIIMAACHFIVKRLSLMKKYGVRTSDVATLLLFIGLHYLSMDAFSVSILPYTVIIIFLVGMTIAIAHAKYYGDIQYKRYFKMFWRFTFLTTFFMYIFVIIFSLVIII